MKHEHAHHTPRRTDTRSARRAFTLIEILVVVLIIIIGTTLIIPAFGRLIESSNYSSSVNAVTSTLGQARALAIQNGLETGVAFLFDTETEEYTLLILEDGGRGGQSFLNCNQVSGEPRYAQKFFPARATSPVVLPAGTGVFGLPMSRQIASGACDDSNTIDADTAAWYAGFRFNHPQDNDVAITPWVFPRNDPRLYMDADPDLFPDEAARDAIGADAWEVLLEDPSDNDARHAVRQAQSFFIRFSPEGSVMPMGTGEPDDAYLEFPDGPTDVSTVGALPYDSLACFDPEVIPSDVVTPAPNPEVWLRPVDQLAVVNLASLTRDTGIRRPWLVAPNNNDNDDKAYAYTVDPGNVPDYLDITDATEPRFLNDDRVLEIGRWIDNNAVVLGFNRYTGNVLRRGQQ